MNKKVVVTGYGVASSIGYGEQEYWNALLKGESNVRPITAFDSSVYNSAMAAEVDWNKVDALLDSNDIPIRKEDIEYEEEATKLAILSTHDAYKHAGLYNVDISSERIGCIVGTLCSSARVQERLWRAQSKGAKTDASAIISYQADRLAEHFAIEGPVSLISTACASFIDAYGFAMDLIREGKCDVMVVAGGDIVSEAVHAGFNSVYSVTKEALKPFDEHRDGFVIGEGAATLILESEEHARARGATIFANAMGYGGSNSAFHLTSPSDDGYAESLAMSRALDESGLHEDDIDYVLAHGTGTHKNDKTELLSVSSALNTIDRDRTLHITSIKGSTGHCMGAAGGMSLIATIKSLQENTIPMTANTTSTDPMFEKYPNIQLVRDQSLPAQVNYVLINSLGFAGNNAVAILGRYS